VEIRGRSRSRLRTASSQAWRPVVRKWQSAMARFTCFTSKVKLVTNRFPREWLSSINLRGPFSISNAHFQT